MHTQIIDDVDPAEIVHNRGRGLSIIMFGVVAIPFFIGSLVTTLFEVSSGDVTVDFRLFQTCVSGSIPKKDNATITTGCTTPHYDCSDLTQHMNTIIAGHFVAIGAFMALCFTGYADLKKMIRNRMIHLPIACVALAACVLCTVMTFVTFFTTFCGFDIDNPGDIGFLVHVEPGNPALKSSDSTLGVSTFLCTAPLIYSMVVIYAVFKLRDKRRDEMPLKHEGSEENGVGGGGGAFVGMIAVPCLLC